MPSPLFTKLTQIRIDAVRVVQKHWSTVILQNAIWIFYKERMKSQGNTREILL